MKQGSTLSGLAKELERQAETKRDFVMSTQSLTAKGNGKLSMSFDLNDENHEYGFTNWGHKQIAQQAGIPKQYYDRMLASSPELVAQNINHWFQKEPQKRLVRTLDGNVRAVLSHRYRPLDYYDLAEHALSKIQQIGCTVESCALTETRLYLKALMPKFEGEVKKGDPVQMGVVLSNSEVGAGSVKIEPLIYRLVCLNGMILEDSRVRKFHIQKGEHDFGEFLRDETRLQIDKAFWMKVSDMIDGTFKQEFFQETLNRLSVAGDNMILGDPIKAVEVTCEKLKIEEGHRGGILKQLVEGKDLSQWGIANAITRHSQDVEDYDSATQLERVGGRIIELPKSQWKEIAEAS